MQFIKVVNNNKIFLAFVVKWSTLKKDLVIDYLNNGQLKIWKCPLFCLVPYSDPVCLYKYNSLNNLILCINF